MLKRPVYIDLEGSDLTGKSTLLHMTFHESDYSKEMCFHDRGILTQYLYNSYLGRYEEDNELWALELYNFVSKNGIIILVANGDTLEQRFNGRGDEEFKLDAIRKINEEYCAFYDNILYAYPTVKRIFVDGKTPKEVFDEAKPFYEYMLKRGRA